MPRLARFLAVAVLGLLFLSGCGGSGEKGKHKDADKPMTDGK